ncbi:MAG: 1-acyl-sn-glycerol-3-phosphate acyltransferase [Spirochaetales bacterium]|nr:1-acyl-sn-glycerol-3-phosphate acyltransferase [Spirochaetales bacterium]
MFVFTTLLGYLTGSLFLLVILLLLLLRRLLRRERLFEPVLKFLTRAIPFLFGIRVKVERSCMLDPDRQYVFMANHVNIFDGFILYGYIAHFVRGIELESHFKWPVWGTIIRAAGNIPISQKSPKQALMSLEQAAVQVRQGTSIVVLPEGHRTRDGRLQIFSRGPFVLAKSAGVELVPIAMKGLYERKTVRSFFVRPGKVVLRFGPNITVADVQKRSAKELRDMTRQRILEMLEEKPET